MKRNKMPYYVNRKDVNMTDLSEFIQIIKSDEKAVDELRDCFARKGTVMDVMTALAEIAQQYGYDLNFDDLTRAILQSGRAARSDPFAKGRSVIVYSSYVAVHG